MTRKMTLFIVLVFGTVMLSLTSSDSTAQAQGRRMKWYESGLVELPPNQMLCITAVNESPDPIQIQFRKIEYMESCIAEDGPCSHSIASNETFDTLMLEPGEGGSIEFKPEGLGIRGVVRSTGPVLMLNHVVDMASGEIAAAYYGNQWPGR